MTSTDDPGSLAVTVIGLGDMGAAIARAFIAAENPTTVWNRTSSRAEALVSQGAVEAESVELAIAASPLVVICVSDYEAVLSTLEPVRNLSGKTLVNVTTGSVAGARDMDTWTNDRNGAYLDGAILAKTSEIGPTKSGAISFSGSQDAWDENARTLSALGSGTTFLGTDPGLTGLHDVAALGMTWSVLNAFLHSVALFEASGQGTVSLVTTLQATLSDVASWLPGFADQIEAGDFPPDGNIHAQLTAMNNLALESQEAGISTALPDFIVTLAERAVMNGDGGQGYPALIEQFRTP